MDKEKMAFCALATAFLAVMWSAACYSGEVVSFVCRFF